MVLLLNTFRRWHRLWKNAEMSAAVSLITSDKNCCELSIDPSALGLDREYVISELGYVNNEIPQFFSEQIDQLLSEYPRLCDIRAAYRVITVSSHDEKSILIDNTLLSLNKTVAFQMKNAERLAIFICTIGDQLENWSTRLFSEEDALRAHFVDTIASVAVENATGILHDFIEQQMLGQGWSVTNRFSPGYCGWPVSEQHLLFSFFPPATCGIELTESALMIPRKSTSGIIGIGSSVKREPYLCDRCANRDCTYRLYRQLKREKQISLGSE